MKLRINNKIFAIQSLCTSNQNVDFVSKQILIQLTNDRNSQRNFRNAKIDNVEEEKTTREKRFAFTGRISTKFTSKSPMF